MARPKGSKNKPRRDLIEMIDKEFPTYDPIRELIKVATSKDRKIGLANKMHANEVVARYIRPQLKSVEHSVGGGGLGKISFSMELDERKDKAK